MNLLTLLLAIHVAFAHNSDRSSPDQICSRLLQAKQLEMKSRSGRKFIVSMNPRGMIDIQIFSSGNKSKDRANSEQVAALLRREGLRARLSARSGKLPFDPQFGFELWISRLDANSPTTRIGIAKVIELLKDR